jgi:hypothetical protein
MRLLVFRYRTDVEVDCPGALLLMSFLNRYVFQHEVRCGLFILTVFEPETDPKHGAAVAGPDIMIEQPPEPDVPKSPDVIHIPPDVNRPIPPGKPQGDDRPDIHPTPPPTDPAPPII